MTAVIEVEGLTKRYGRLTAVDHISFTVGHGEVVGFLGPNGAGKTTTIRMLLGLIKPTSGRKRVLGEERLSRAASKVGSVIEEPSFYPYLSGRDNLRLAATLYGGVDEKRIYQVLELVGLLGRERDRVSKYSQGMRQRLGLAQAMLPRPELLVLDEPTNGLDPDGVVEIRNTIKALGQSGVTIFLSSHLLSEVERVASRVIIIEKGKIKADGSVKDLLSRLAGGKAVMKLRTGDLDRTAQLLSAQPWAKEFTRDDTSLRLILAAQDVERVMPILVGAGIKIYEFDQEDFSLEDLYLGTVQEGHHNHAAQGGRA
ncbi:MAG: ABC transporter ATP-binding protein [Deinococcus sp.]|nr:ABC transporter ATP-binding protein [Deinococcus sp.]